MEDGNSRLPDNVQQAAQEAIATPAGDHAPEGLVRRQSSADRMLRVLAKGDGAYFILDVRSRTIVQISQAFVMLTGYTEGEAIGKSSHLLLGSATEAEAVTDLDKAETSLSETTVTLHLHRKDGDAFRCLVSVSPLSDGTGAVTQLCYLLSPLGAIISNGKDAVRMKSTAVVKTSSSHQWYGEGFAGLALADQDFGRESRQSREHRVDVKDAEALAPARSRSSFARSSHAGDAEDDTPLDISAQPYEQPELPVMLQFESINYWVEIGLTQQPWWDVRRFQKDKEAQAATKKQILFDMSGLVMPGDLLALMGPSGSGKTTLLSVLGGRITNNVEGHILYNGRTYAKAMRRRMGFVMQDDVFFANLTVRETLTYAAMLKLPDSVSVAMKKERAEAIIDTLGLRKAADTIIGGAFRRGVSGGERKRVNVGHELVTNPSLLFLDEPTSGLDSTTALRLLHTLRNLAASGRTIITTIHQPSSRMFQMFDKLILLADGHVMYYGAGKDAMKYFANLGYSPQFETNPADYVLDLATGEAVEGRSALESKEFLIQAYESRFASKARHLAEPERANSGMRAIYRKEEEVAAPKRWPVAWWTQFRVLAERATKERRFDAFSGLKIFQVIAVAVITGLLWLRRGASTEAGISDLAGYLFFLCVFWSFFPLFNSLFTFPQERAILLKERGSGMYRLSAYFLGRSFSDAPMELLLPTVFICISYWMVGLRASVDFLWMLLTILVTVMTAVSFGLWMGATFKDVKQATTVSSVITLTLLLVGGFYVRQVPAWLEWLKWLSYIYYSYRILLKLQFGSIDTYQCGTPPCLIENHPSLSIPDFNVKDSVALEVPILCGMFVLFRIFGYLALRFLNKPK
eukprot:jgi/Chlat1/3897/Chrsp26S04180